MAENIIRTLPIGAEVQPGGSVHFRVWAPASPTVAVECAAAPGRAQRVVPLQAEKDGYFSGLVANVPPGSLYKFRLASGSYPDPASRYQPEGPHGPSQIVSAADFPWTDHQWRGRPPQGQVIYELHLGTFTRDGTWRAAMAELPELQELGVTTIELMPIAEFPGRFGWGYDGVLLFAPTRVYGSPDDARAFVDRAHQLGLMVILDVVYNHLGPDGNYLRQFSPDYFSKIHPNEWGDALNFDTPPMAPSRELFVSNARYWISEFHFDGLRLDATQQIYDNSPEHLVAEIAAAARAAAGDRTLFLVAENERQEANQVRPPEKGGFGLDAIWNDDWHHSAKVAASGRAEAYYRDYQGTARELLAALKHGFLYQGQWYSWQRQRRGTPSRDLAPHQFVVFLDNHDQVANSMHGHRLHELANPGVWRTLTAVTLLAPQTPLLFQGQEFAASSPFLYFADHQPELAALVRKGRHQFLRQFPSINSPEGSAQLADPSSPATFERCKLNFDERATHRAAYQLHRDLLRLRREDPAIRAPDDFDGAVLHERALVVRWFSAAAGDRLLLVNLGADLQFNPCPEPLLAPVAGTGWRVLWTSEAIAYGGHGIAPPDTDAGWMIPGHTAVLLAPDHEHRQPFRAKLSEKD
jgi:maltooligosyltrehalose trehalohydrolase